SLLTHSQSAHSSNAQPATQQDIPHSAFRIPHSQIARPDAILFNGGFFTPAITRERIVEAIAGWFREKGKRYQPKVLSNETPEGAVAIGAAYYGQVRRGSGVRISGGGARAYYIRVQTEAKRAEQEGQGGCGLPRGNEEGKHG